MNAVATSPKTKFPRADALYVATELCAALSGVTSRIVTAGSLRRRKPEVSDIEILFVPQFGTLGSGEDLFRSDHSQYSITDRTILELEGKSILTRRLNIKGHETYGPENKLMRHTLSGIPADLFSVSEESWWNSIVCRTGPAEHNIKICSLAREFGYKWNPTGPGFTHLESGRIVPMASERAVFEFLNLTYLEPWER